MTRRGRRRVTSRRVPLLLASLYACCVVSCAHYRLVETERLCPAPTEEQVDAYAALVESREYRPAVEWVSRVVGYCWPNISRLPLDE